MYLHINPFPGYNTGLLLVYYQTSDSRANAYFVSLGEK